MKLIVSRELAKVLTVSRKSNHFNETFILQMYNKDFARSEISFQ